MPAPEQGPDTKHQDYQAWVKRWQKWRDLAAGEDALTSAECSTSYIPRLYQQDEEEYREYLTRASFYPATGRTIDALVGALFYRAPLQELPRDLASLSEALRPALEVAAREIVTVGRLGVLCEIKDGQPVLCLYRAESVINWRRAPDGRLSLVVLLEQRSRAVGLFGTEFFDVYRALLLTPRGYEQVEITESKDEKGAASWQEIGRSVPLTPQGLALDFIPFEFVNFATEGEACGASPIASLAQVNLHHYQDSADYQHALHLTACPFLHNAGFGSDRPDKFRVGSSTVLWGPIGSTSQYVAAGAEGIPELAKSLAAKEDQMARLGGSFLRASKREAETAEAVRLSQSAETGVLSTVAHALSRSFTRALSLLAAWYGTKEPATVTLSQEFFDSKLTIEEANFFAAQYQSGVLDLAAYLDILHAGGQLRKEIYERLKELQRANEDRAKPAPQEAQKEATHGTQAYSDDPAH